ncbi:hypothetical protein I203_107984 [Kwoniella mangroviensis CBS 8507]|uniref:hypothetical protein n=1 Tax=Kwoniella mangroviensis CBS 8507 TaxID=1296122 RepID=UPI00080D6938|nr:uncharacterized protein I203_04878 [Kwoniella mangroviensis CBS 8507]OCF65858.1 hypothetical protein I203_04878 [Kwoniella mangroviensis CBS 8507]
MGAAESRPSTEERRQEIQRVQLKIAAHHGRVFRESIPPDDISTFARHSSTSPVTVDPQFKDTANGNNELPELPREIWEKIIYHLRRQMGPRAEQDTDPGHFHQQDLTVAMRVNKLWYSIAAPILYTRVITTRPDLLLSHIHSRLISSARLSKLELFQYIYRLDIGYNPTHAEECDIDPPFSKNDNIALSRAGLFSIEKSRWPATTLVRDMDFALQTTNILRTIRQTLPEGIQLFGNLQILTVGAFGKSQHSRWDVGYNFLATGLERFQPPSSGLGFSDLGGLLAKKHQEELDLLNMRHRFGYELTSNASNSLEHICVDNFTGPLSVFLPHCERLQTYTIHITKSHTDTSCRPLPIIEGVTNKWIIEDESWERRKDTGREDWIVDRGSTYQWLKGRIYALDPAQFTKKDTKLVIYGALDEARVDEEFGGYLLGFLISEWSNDWSWERKRGEVNRFLEIDRIDIEGVRLEEDSEGRCDACGFGFGFGSGKHS